MSKKTTVSLVLGSGGARGLTHVGVIKWLQEHNYEIKSISGCSMGALIGGFFAAGKLDAYIEWLQSVDGLTLLRLLDFKGSGGFVAGDTLIKKLEELLGGDIHIENLPLRFTAVAADIENEKEIWINEDSLLQAIRASISIPLFFAPYRYKGMMLIDGGVLNPVPIAPTFHDGTDMTIAVNLGGEATDDAPLFAELAPEDKTLTSKIKNYLTDVALPATITEEKGMYGIANQSFEAMQSTIARMKLATYPPDIEIDIPRNICGTFDFNKSKQIIEYGYNSCAKTFKNHKRV